MDIEVTEVSGKGTRTFSVPMPSELEAELKAFRYRMSRARQLLNDNEEFIEAFACLPFDDWKLIEEALKAYIRENED